MNLKRQLLTSLLHDINWLLQAETGGVATPGRDRGRGYSMLSTTQDNYSTYTLAGTHIETSS